ncbi:hypothetical protein J2R98_002317 [Alkalibacillus filiformis]|uniref:Uncharacterized protein n=1 Tax=Alkalibacillus filiformis TaxID=200990 RepID=A0ABU0DVI7_9BACI|nr:hypothetical protein [Alkalibacillus filiformis]MDQ0352473.1 hypothetical protein [Alkalibacillus filiformis]
MSNSNSDFLDELVDVSCELEVTQDVSDELSILRGMTEGVNLDSKSEVILTHQEMARKIRMLDELLRQNVRKISRAVEAAEQKQKEEA